MIKCNLKTLRFNHNDLSQKELSKAAKIREQTISDMETGKTKSYSVENLNKLCEYFKCDISDILSYAPDAPSIVCTSHGKISIPISVVAAGAGISTKFTIDNAFEKKSFPSDVVPSNADCGIRINGDSMSPDYPNDCTVWVKQTTEVKYGDEVIAILNGCPYFKIYDREGLRSINPEYPIIKVYDDDKFSVFGKVIGVYTGNIKWMWGNYMFGNSPSINDKLIKMIDLVDQKANINQSDIKILKNVLTESLEHINQLNARVDKVEKTLGDTVDLLNEVADMLSSK